MNKPVGPKNREVKDALSDLSAVQFNIVVWGISILIGLTILGLAVISGCAKNPKTHEEWASYCVDQPDEKFRNCLEQWDAWEKGEK